MEVASIDQRDINRKPGEVQGRLEPAEPSADDDDSGASCDGASHECQDTMSLGGQAPGAIAQAATQTQVPSRF